jgi:methyl-accepting chemotaxis protein
MRSRQFTIGKKLLLSVGSILMMTIVLGLTSLHSINKLNTSLENSTRKTAQRAILVGLIDAAGSDLLAGQRGVMLYSMTREQTAVDRSKTLIKQAEAQWQTSIDQIRPLLITDASRQIVDKLQEQLNDWKPALDEIILLSDKGDSRSAVEIALKKCVPIYDANMRETDRLRDTEKLQLAQDADAGDAISSAGRWAQFVLLGLSLAIGGSVIQIVRGTSRTLQKAAGELSQTADQVSGAAEDISSSSQALARGVAEQAASITETSASSEEITAMTRRTAEHSRSASELMDQTSLVVNDANRTLDLMQTSMQEINASSDKIGEIIKVIDGIAFQTNILALNAAVEAARAGDAGMGFAVVADEVRNLAQRSAQAARDTAGLIEASIAKSADGRTKLDQLSAAVGAITERSEKVKVLINEVHVGSEEQARGVEQIAHAMVQMEKVTQSSSATAQQAASAGQSMRSQSRNMLQVVEELEKMVGAQDKTAA